MAKFTRRSNVRRVIGRRIGSLLLAVMALGGTEVVAESDPNPGSFRVNGFGTLGVSQLSTPTDWGYRREISEPGNSAGTRGDLDSRLGIQLNYDPTTQFGLVGQVIVSRQSSASNVGDRIALAFAAFRPNADWSIRLGRVNFDAYLLADHRDVGFTYEFARPPIEFYEQIPSYLNGADLSRVWNDSGTLWRLKGMAGSTAVASDNFRLGIRSVFGIVLSRQTGGLQLRASVIRGRIANGPPELDPLTDALNQLSQLPIQSVAAESDALHSALGFHVYSSYFALGAEYESGDYFWSSEITRVTGVRGFDAGYGSVGRHFGPVSAYGVLSAISSERQTVSAPDWTTALTPVIGPAAAQQAQMLGIAAAFAINSLSDRQRTVSLGARWNLASRVALKTQWDHIWVDANGGGLWAGSTLDKAQADIYSVLLDFVF
jgi:hypothetical protein